VSTFIFKRRCVVGSYEDEFALVEGVARRIVESHGYVLYEFKLNKAHGMDYVRLFIKKRRSAITHEDCILISRELEEFLEAKNVMKRRYDLEVSSPGAEAPFVCDDDYVENIGNAVKLVLKSEIMGARELVGRLASYENGRVGIEIVDKKRTGSKEPVLVAVERGEIEKGHRVIQIVKKRA
jgi:ribosome maturation factor RimP